MKSHKTTASLRFLLFIVALVSIVGGGLLWWHDAVSPVDGTDQSAVVFSVKRGEGVRVITANLAQNRLIRSPTGFFILVKLLRLETQLQAGDFRLNRSMDAHAIATELTHGIADVWVTTLEGWRVEEIATKLAKDLDIPEAEFLKVAREGYMFPDTYLIPRDATAAAIAAMLMDTFHKKVTTQMKSDAKIVDLTFPEAVTLASIVEREGNSDTDRPAIAGVLLKRLKSGWALQADATLQYALGYQPREKTWWKKELWEEDKKIDSPFNTYTNTGLPPSPIANPGLSSIKAVIYPKQTDYWYYIHDKTGAVHFAKTEAEHLANIAKYLR